MDGWAGTYWVYLNVSDLHVAWEAYRAQLMTAAVAGAPDGWPAVSLVLAGAIRRGEALRLQHELTMERVRVTDSAFAHAVSRVKGMYYFLSKEDALRAPAAWTNGVPPQFAVENLAEVGFTADLRFSIHDSRWINRHMWEDHPFGAGDEGWIRSYWAGEPLDDTPPLPEVIAEGTTWVFGTKLRERAHKLIRASQPDVLPALELARVSAELGSSLGHIAPLVTRESADRGRLAYYMDFQDAHNRDFLARLRDFEGPRNLEDLNPRVLAQEAGFHVPDLTDREFPFEVNADLSRLIF